MSMPAWAWTGLTVGVLSALALVGAPAAAAESEGQATLAAGQRIGLFIGIDDYPRLPGRDLAGAVHDATAMQRLFEQHFGFGQTRLVKDELATRDGIGEALRWLIHQARQAQQTTDEPVTVVLYYAGHGGQVRDQATPDAGADEDDGYDETWIPHDSSFGGDRDIRDDDLHRVHLALADLGAQVLIISDSCHSGSIHRDASFARARGLVRSEPAKGPADPLLPELAAAPATAPPEGAALPGFVALTACADHQLAREHEDEDGAAWGRMTFALRDILHELDDAATHRELHRRLLVRFHELWPNDPGQVPQLHGSAAKQGELFLAGGYPPVHASVVPGSIRERRLDLDMGELHGVAVNDAFAFFADLTHLRTGRAADRLAVANVVAVSPFTCTVELPAGVTLDASAKATLRAARMSDFVVHAAPDLPEPARAELQRLEAEHRLRVAQPDQAWQVAVYFDDEQQRLAMYSPDRLPDPGAPLPTPLAAVPFADTPEHRRAFAEQLLYLGRVHRLMSLDDGVPDVQATLVGPTLEPGDAAPADVPQLRPGDRFTVAVTNAGRTPLYPTVLVMDAFGRVDVLYPLPQDTLEPIRAGATLQVGGGPVFRAMLDDPQRAAQRGYERTHIKVIATAQPVDLWPLVTPPAVDEQALAEVKAAATAHRGADDAVLILLADALHGATRGAGRVSPAEVQWASASVVFDVLP